MHASLPLHCFYFIKARLFIEDFLDIHHFCIVGAEEVLIRVRNFQERLHLAQYEERQVEHCFENSSVFTHHHHNTEESDYESKDSRRPENCPGQTDEYIG